MLDNDHVIHLTTQFVKTELSNAESGHDWLHIERVLTNASKILETEPSANYLTVTIGTLLHDIADPKFHNNDENIGVYKTTHFLQEIDLEDKVVNEIVNIVRNVSYGGGKQVTDPSLELQIVQDADRLDAIGAIGIARCFNYGGFKNRTIYDQYALPKMDLTPETYRKHKAPSLNHFFEKLLRLKNGMHTKKGREMALQRHQFLITYLEQFFEEVDAPSEFNQLLKQYQ